MKHFFLILSIAFFAACNEAPKEKSEILKEAEGVHEEMLVLKQEVADKIHDREEALNKRIALAEETQDVDLQEKYQVMMNKLQKVHDQFHEWESNLAEIPGHAHTHEPGEEHDHDHDHAELRVMEGLSDQEHLDLQNAQMKELKRIANSLDKVSK